MRPADALEGVDDPQAVGCGVAGCGRGARRRRLARGIRRAVLAREEALRQREVRDQAEAELAGKGRLVIRPSGTEPVIRVMAEGDDLGQVERVVDRICDAVRKAAA